MIVFNIQHKMENFKSVIPTCSTASCPKCSRNVTLKKHANSGSIANMNDCLHHGFCENCSCPQHEFFVCIACLQHPSAWSYHRNCGILMSWKALNKHAKSPILIRMQWNIGMIRCIPRLKVKQAMPYSTIKAKIACHLTVSFMAEASSYICSSQHED